MSDVAIRVERLGKKYTIGHQKSGDFRNSVGEKLGSLFGRRATSEEEFWALKDVSFEIKRGEAVGIIGRNGAGKSTLLKILSRITDPTTGRYEINGRVSSLLEVGTGFHAELTGRENIYLNGTILGMKRKEIKSKFDEIVTFSGVEKFLDTPVKHYSSGMKVRLAFSVAAHLEPEILIIDEVLAVGDAEFQKKCLGKMDEVSREGGRTVVFVSHNMSAIETLCNKGVFLIGGQIVEIGNISDCIHRYLSSAIGEHVGFTWSKLENESSKSLEISSGSIELLGNQPLLKLIIRTFLRSNLVHKKAFIAYDLLYEDSTPIFQAIPVDKPFIEYNKDGQYVNSSITLPPLIPGSYKLSVWVGPHYAETYDWQQEIFSFSIDNSPVPERTHPHSKRNGFIVPSSCIIE